MNSERIGDLVSEIEAALNRAVVRGHDKDARRLAGKLQGIELAAGALRSGGNTSALVDAYQRRQAQAERNGHANTATKLSGVVEGLFQVVGHDIATPYDF